jgi:hypothetical protein
MATAYKILGQVAPTDTNNTDLYTVPSSTQTVVSTISVTNDTATSATFRIYIRKDGATAAALNTLYYDTPLAGNSTMLITAGLTIDAADVITVQNGTANALTFQAFGSEVTP